MPSVRSNPASAVGTYVVRQAQAQTQTERKLSCLKQFLFCLLANQVFTAADIFIISLNFNTVNQKCPLQLTYFVSTSRCIEKNAKRRPLRVEMDRIVLQRLIRWPGFYSLRLLGFSIWCIGTAIFKLKNHLIGVIIG